MLDALVVAEVLGEEAGASSSTPIAATAVTTTTKATAR